jgi:hypothetical protein
MTMADSESATSDASSSAQEPSGFAAVARRISRCTVNLLASAIVIVACLAIGSQIISWWYEARPLATPQSPAEGSVPLPDVLPQELRLWTSHGSLTVERVRGDLRAVQAAMRRRCVEEAATAPLAAELRPGEERFLARLANSAPIEQTGGMDLYQPDGELTMVVAVNRKARRIAAWSFALPAEEAVWSCYTVRPADSQPADVPGATR